MALRLRPGGLPRCAILAGLVATWLDRNLSDGAIVVVGMGRNVGAVSEHPTCIASST